MDAKQLKFYRDVGEKIAYWRGYKHITQKDLAHAIRLTPSTLACIEQGRRRPTLWEIVLIANALNLSIPALLTGNDLL